MCSNSNYIEHVEVGGKKGVNSDKWVD